LTHADLVSRAVRWLRNTRHCSLICTRQLAIANEQPDVIGWRSGGLSVLIECKVSISDFNRDADKPHRMFPGAGMGNERYYLTPGALVEAHKVPYPFGLLECWQHRIVKRKDAVFVAEKNTHEELKHAIAMAVRGAQEFDVAVSAGCLIDCGL